MSIRQHITEYGKNYVVSGTRSRIINTATGAMKIGDDMYYEGGMKNNELHGKGLYISPNVVFDGYFMHGYIDAKPPNREVCRMYVYDTPRIKGCSPEFSQQTPYTLAIFGRFRLQTAALNRKPNSGNSFFNPYKVMPGSVAYYRPNHTFWVMGDDYTWILDERRTDRTFKDPRDAAIKYKAPSGTFWKGKNNDPKKDRQRRAPDWTPPTPRKRPVGIFYENNNDDRDDRDFVKQKMGAAFLFQLNTDLQCKPYIYPMAKSIVQWSADGNTRDLKILHPNNFNNTREYHKVYYEIDKLLYKNINTVVNQQKLLANVVVNNAKSFQKNLTADTSSRIRGWGKLMLFSDNENRNIDYDNNNYYNNNPSYDSFKSPKPSKSTNTKAKVLSLGQSFNTVKRMTSGVSRLSAGSGNSHMKLPSHSKHTERNKNVINIINKRLKNYKIHEFVDHKDLRHLHTQMNVIMKELLHQTHKRHQRESGSSSVDEQLGMLQNSIHKASINKNQTQIMVRSLVQTIQQLDQKVTALETQIQALSSQTRIRTR